MQRVAGAAILRGDGFRRLPGPRNLSVESLYKILAQGNAKLIRRGIA